VDRQAEVSGMGAVENMEKEKKDDRRSQRTRQMLRQALIDLMLEKHYETITVDEIASRANLSRSTFYLHYHDKDDLMIRCVEESIATFIFQIRENNARQPWEYTFAPFFEHLKEVYPLYRALLWAGKANCVFVQVQKDLSQWFESRLRAAHPDQANDPPVELAAQAAVGALIALIEWWLNNKMAYPPERMDEIYKKLVMNGLNIYSTGTAPSEK
jgi:AcrR family transcriptional regulator